MTTICELLIKDLKTIISNASKKKHSLEDIYWTELNAVVAIKQLLSSKTTIIEDIEERKKQGVKQYGTPLTVLNCTELNSLAEAYEECLDKLYYLRHEIEKKNKKLIEENDKQRYQDRTITTVGSTGGKDKR